MIVAFMLRCVYPHENQPANAPRSDHRWQQCAAASFTRYLCAYLFCFFWPRGFAFLVCAVSFVNSFFLCEHPSIPNLLAPVVVHLHTGTRYQPRRIVRSACHLWTWFGCGWPSTDLSSLTFSDGYPPKSAAMSWAIFTETHASLCELNRWLPA